MVTASVSSQIQHAKTLVVWRKPLFSPLLARQIVLAQREEPIFSCHLYRSSNWQWLSSRAALPRLSSFTVPQHPATSFNFHCATGSFPMYHSQPLQCFWTGQSLNPWSSPAVFVSLHPAQITDFWLAPATSVRTG